MEKKKEGKAIFRQFLRRERERGENTSSSRRKKGKEKGEKRAPVFFYE